MARISRERIRRAIEGRFNPIRGLKPAKLAQVLDRYHAGDFREASLLWDAMENRDLLIRNVASKRKKAVARAQWEVLTVDDSPEAMEEKEVLEVFYNNLVATSVMKENERGGMGLLVRQMMDAVGKGFAVHEIVWKPIQGKGINRRQRRLRSASPAGALRGQRSSPDGAQEEIESEAGSNAQFLTAEFRFVPLWFFENRTGRLRYLEEEGQTEGVEMKPAEWLITVGDGIMEATSVAYTFKHMSLKDWSSFCEKFGMPGVLGRCHGNPGSEEAGQIEDAVAGLMNDWAAVLYGEDNIELLEVKSSGETPFKPKVEYWDRGIAAIWRGADLSTISQGQAGVGASLQGDESDLLTEDDSGLVTETFWDQVDRHVLQYTLGITEAPKAYIKILPPKRQNVEQDLAIDRFMREAGVPQSVDDTVERYGRPLPAEGEALLSNPVQEAEALAAQASSADGGPARTGHKEKKQLENEDRLRKAKRNLMGPVLSELRRIEKLEGREQEDALRALQAELPALKKRLENEAGEGELAEVLAEELKTALVEGFSKRKGTR